MGADIKNSHEVDEESRKAAEEMAARYNDRSRLTARDLELGQHVRDLYASGARLWTKDMLRYAEAELCKVPLPKTAMVQSMDGTQRSVPLPLNFESEYPTTEMDSEDDDFAYGPWRIGPDFTSYEYLADRAERKYEDEEGDSRSATEEELFNVSCALTFSSSRSYYRKADYHSGGVKAAWDETCANWTKTQACKEMVDTISSISHIPKSVSKIVCFGLGALELGSDLDSNAKERRSEKDGLPLRRSMTQHAVALTMAAAFGAKVGKAPLKILAQDPAYSETDKQLLRAAGIEVVEGLGALGFTYVDEDTVVYSISPNVPVKQIVADLARPAAMVWNQVTPAEKKRPQWQAKNLFGDWTCISPWCTDPDSPRTRELVKSYRVYEFPEDRIRFGDVSIYVRSDEKERAK